MISQIDKLNNLKLLKEIMVKIKFSMTKTMEIFKILIHIINHLIKIMEIFKIQIHLIKHLNKLINSKLIFKKAYLYRVNLKGQYNNKKMSILKVFLINNTSKNIIHNIIKTKLITINIFLNTKNKIERQKGLLLSIRKKNLNY